MLKIAVAFLSLMLIAESGKLYRVPLQRSQTKLTKENYQADYFCTDIYLGQPRQKIRVLVDTGSANLYVPSVNCEERPEDVLCHNHNQYIEHDSGTREPMNLPFEFPGTLEGHIVNDIVRIGNLSIVGQPFAAITKTLRSSFIQPAFDGIFGMGFRKLARNYIKPPFENIYEQHALKKEAFSFYLKRNGTIEDAGYLILGGSDPELYVDELTYAPLSNDVYWQIAINNIKMNDETICEFCEALIDTGTVNIAIPGKAYQKVLNMLQVDSKGFVDCNIINRFPIMKFKIGNRVFELEPKDYILQVYKDDDLVCITTFVYGGTKLWILGNTFMSKHYTEFDQGNMRIGFADAV